MQISTASTAITTTSVSMMHHGQVKLDLGQVLNIQDKDLALSKGIAYLTSLRPSDPRRVKPSDPQESEESHFQKLGLIDIQRYLDVSTQVMEKLDALFQGSDNSYLPWVKYFDACNKAKIAGGYSDENLEVFIKGISQLTIRLLLKDGQKEMIDWRIGKQLLALQRLFEPSLTAMVKPEQLVEAFLREIEEGLKGLIWQDQNRTTLFTKQALQNLQEVIPPLKNDKKVLNAVISGRFDKADFAGLGHTLILGEDGGLFLLLNAVNEEEKKILEDAVSSDYLKDKVSGVKQTTRKEQIVIGKGGFGKVRFAVSLFGAKTRPGDIICIKKTGSFAKLNADMRARQEVGYPVAEQVIDATLGDYFTGDIAKAVYSPAIVDMALVMSKEFIKKPLHQKGYLMMEIMPQNTGIRIFKDPEYQKWEYQKPYLIDVMEGVTELLARKLAMTDLKPENTLYNKDTRKATIIDLGGAIEVADLAKFDTASSFQSTPGYQAPELLQKGTIDITKALAYSCGKILEKITNSEGFTTDYNKEEIEQLIKKLTNQVPIKRLSIDEALRKIRDMGDDSSTQQAIFSHYIIKIKERLATNKASLSINDDIEVTEKLYLNSEVTRLDSYKHRGLKREDLMKRLSLFFHRKDQAVEEEEEEEKRLEEPTEPETTDKTFELQTITTLLGSIQYLSLEHLKQMTVGYLNFIDTLERHQLSSEFGDFMQELDNIIEKGKKTESQTKAKVKDKLEQYQRQVEKQDTQLKEVQRKTKLKEESGVGDKQVFLLLGAPGSGKSITVQLRFIQAVNNWKPGKALPVYFNLANGIDLAEILTSMNQLLGTKVTLKELYNQQVDLYVDSFDQGIGEKRLEERDGLIDNYIKQLSTQPGIKEQDPNGDEASARRRKIKVLVSCRSDYLQNNSDEAWFAPKVSAKKIGSDETIDQPQLNLVETGYIVPITYQTDKELATNIDKHLDYRKQGEAVKRKKAFDVEYNADWYTEKIKSADLKEFIDTGFMFDIVMETLPTLTSSKITRQDIYTAFVTIHADRALKKHPWTQEQLQQIEHSFPNYGTNSDEQSFFAQLGQYIASQLHISNQLMLNQNSIIFLLLNYRKDLPFRYQMAYYLLRVLPVKIEIKVQDSVGVPQDHSDISRKRQEEIKIGFTNDTLKNYYLVQAILQELEKTGTSQLLACRNIVKDKQLINSLFQAIEYGPKAETWRQILLQTVLRTKIDKCPEAITCAANAITVLNLLQYVLPGQDLSNISIKGANLRNCWLPYTNFSGAVLTNVNLTNAKLMDANLAKTNLSGVKLSIFPDLLGHKNDVYKVIYSPDGKKLATCDEDSRSKTIIIWDVATGTQLHSLSGGLLCFSPDGQTIASASDKTMTIWDVATAKQLHTLNGRSLSYSPKGQTLAVLPHGKDPVQIFTTNCKLLLALKSSDEATSLSYSPDGKTIATGSNNNAKIWDIATGKLLHTLTGKLMDTYTVCYSPDGQTLAAISSKRIRIWNVATNEELPQILTDLGSEGVKYSPDSRTIATFYYGTLRIWDVAAGKQLGTDIEAHSYEITSMSYSPDGRSIATASKDNTIRIWDTDSGKQLGSDLMGHSNEVYSISYSPDGKTIASGSRDNTVRIWSVSTEEQLEATRNGHSQAVTSAIYSPDGKTIATASEEKTMKFWDAATGGRKKADWDFEDKFMFCYAPNHKTIAIGSGKVSILDAVTGKMLGKQMELPTVIERVRSMSYSPNSKILVTGLEDGTILIWDPATQKQMGKLKGHSGWIYSLSFSPDGKTLATGSKDYTVKIWDVAKYKQLGVDLKGHSDQVRAVSFSPDGKTVASGSEDKTIKLWDIATYKQVGADFVGHSDYVLCLSFSPDSKTIVSGSRDTMIKLWNVATGKQQGSDLQGHLGDINSVSFSPNGKTITSASDDRSVKIWAERNGKWMVIRDVNAADTPLNVENMTIEDAILSKQNMTIFEQRKCNKQQNIILAKEQETIQEEQEETQQIQESTKKLETELFAKFKLENNVSNDLNSDNNQQLPRSNFIKLEISLSNNQEEQKQEQKQEKEEEKEKEKETQSEQANIEPDTSKRQSNPNHNITPEPYTTGPPQNQAIRNNSSTCCGVFCIQGLQYHNPILNNPQLLNKLIAVCGSVSSALALAEAIYVNRREN